MQTESKTPPTGSMPEVEARREALRRRLAEHGITLHLPGPGRRWNDDCRLPVPADELSDAVIRVRRGDL